MFYISPYHNSTQIVFCDLERITGRPLGILLYLLTVLFGFESVELLLYQVRYRL